MDDELPHRLSILRLLVGCVRTSSMYTYGTRNSYSQLQSLPW
jgi:hypothetical protein